MQCRYGFLHLKAIANIIPKRLAHIRHNSTGFPPSPISDLHHRFREQDGILLRLHKSTAARLHIEHYHIRPRSKLLAHYAAGNQRDAVHGRSHIPQGINLFVRRGKIGSLRHYGKFYPVYLHKKVLFGKFCNKSRETLKLIDGSPGMPKSPPRHLRHGDTERRDNRSYNQCCFIPHPARTVFVRFFPNNRR